MRDALAIIALLTGTALWLLARDLHRAATTLATRARNDRTDAARLADQARQHRIAAAAQDTRGTINGPSGLTDLFVRHYGWDRLTAAQVANTAAWHFESPLAAAIEEARGTPACDPHPITGRCPRAGQR